MYTQYVATRKNSFTVSLELFRRLKKARITDVPWRVTLKG